MKYGLLALIITTCLFQGISQVHLTRTRVKYKKTGGIRVIKSIRCDAKEGAGAFFRNYQKRTDSLARWWLQFREVKAPTSYVIDNDPPYWQIDVGQMQLTAIQRYASDGALEGWEISSRTDTLILSNFQPDVFARDRLSCALGKRYVQETVSEDAAPDFSIEKMLVFTQARKDRAALLVEEAYSVDDCADEFRVVAAFLATWILAKEYSSF